MIQRCLDTADSTLSNVVDIVESIKLNVYKKLARGVDSAEW
jgi:hypothetical protein